jgi:hypothetical protein
MQLKTLLTRQHNNLALLIGNGINRYNSHDNNNSWDALLTLLAQQHLPDFGKQLPSGMSLTEFYDVLDLGLRGQIPAHNAPGLQQQFCALMADWRAMPQHTYVMEWAKKHAVPVLTTNFEQCLSDAIGGKAFLGKGASFTDFYPWEAYFSTEELSDPCAGFGIWHINGMQKYHRSIRLGLTHYMGSVERARVRLHKGSRRLSAGGEIHLWDGASTWLQILFHRPLAIIGLGLAENEVFLRWLLIERAKYYKDFPARYQPAWFVHTANERDIGKLYFLKAVGVEAFAVPDYDAIYGENTWT